ncbi:MAG: polysaccharide deacetylase family protein [Verrucomicrobiota bacterium]
MLFRFLLCAALASSTLFAATGCRSNKAKKEAEKADAFAWNRGFGDERISEDVHSAVNSARKKMRNPDMNLPPVDLSRASSVTYSSVRVNGPFVAMTFDDGPHPTLTPRLLDILKDRNVRATFFVLAPLAKRHPQIIQRMIREGHEVANHTVTHGNIAKMSPDKVRSELRGGHEAIVQASGRPPTLFRPPYGAIQSSQKVWINDEFGYKTIMWNVDPRDWQDRKPGLVSSRLINGAKPGAILLAHDIHSTTIAAMPSALDGILAKGYRFVTVSQLISMERPAAIAAGEKKPLGAGLAVEDEVAEARADDPAPLPLDAGPSAVR